MAEIASYRVLPEASLVAIHATSTVHPIDGEANGIEGSVEVTLDGGRPDLTQPVSASIELAVADLRSKNPAYDLELRRRLDARRYPLITGRLTSVSGPEGEDGYRVTGDLTFHGATVAVEVDMTVTFDGATGLEARWSQTIDIRDFKVKPPRILMFKVDPAVRVEVVLVAERME